MVIDRHERSHVAMSAFAESKKPAETWPTHEWRDRLDALISAAQKAGVSSRSIAEALRGKVEALAIAHAISAPADAMRLWPRSAPRSSASIARRPKAISEVDKLRDHLARLVNAEGNIAVDPLHR